MNIMEMDGIHWSGHKTYVCNTTLASVRIGNLNIRREIPVIKTKYDKNVIKHLPEALHNYP